MTRGELDLPDAPACPLLGLAADPRTHFTFPHPGHRCHAAHRPSAVEQARQTRYCLTADFASCDRYRTRESAADGTSSATRARMPAVVHVFREGDSLARIAAAYGVTVEQLVAANNLAGVGSVADSQRLVIPLAPSSSSTPGAPAPRADRSG